MTINKKKIKAKERIEKLKKFFGVSMDKQLGALLSVSSGSVAQWKRKGFIDLDQLFHLHYFT